MIDSTPWRRPFTGEPGDVLQFARKLAEHQHDGSDASDMFFDMVLDDLRAAIAHYDKRFPHTFEKLPGRPQTDWPDWMAKKAGGSLLARTSRPEAARPELTDLSTTNRLSYAPRAMARDTFVYWKNEKPTKDEVQTILEDYLAGMVTSLTWRGGRFYVILPGAPSWPFQRVGPATPAQRGAWLELAREMDGAPRSRCFEVYLDAEYVDVITRHDDEVTNAIASTFARLCARAWNGRVEE